MVALILPDAAAVVDAAADVVTVLPKSAVEGEYGVDVEAAVDAVNRYTDEGNVGGKFVERTEVGDRSY